ncbi:uncharacterized protein JCM15063_006255 [Sporobolomyces koalae]|uniref:uncharacterized protein n=1 Tax=Sporobolomyces koalae TaxID=500713 RepID=UPI00317A5754
MPVSSRSTSLRQQGNESFRTGQYLEAVDEYTQACTAQLEALEHRQVHLLSEDVKEHLAAILSNRAAARTNLLELDLALLDAAAAHQVRPTFSRAKARQAEALTRLHSFQEARSAYLEAVELAEDAPSKARYHAALAQIEKQLEAQRTQEQSDSNIVQAEEALEFARRYRELARNGGNMDNLVSAESAMWAWDTAEEAWVALDEQLSVLDDGTVSSVSPSPVLDIADAIVTDARGFHIPPGKDDKFPLLEKIRLQTLWDLKACQVEQYLGKDPKVVVDELDEEVSRDGWKRVRVAIAHLVRVCFVTAYINELQGETFKACSQYIFVLGVLQEGRERWKGISDDERGSTLRFTFERKVKMHLLDALVSGHYRATAQEEKAKYSLSQVKALAEELTDDCQASKAPSDAISTFAFQVQPIVAAAKAFAYTLRDQAEHRDTRVTFSAGHWLHPTTMRACARMYQTAGELLPEDDPEKVINLFNALAFDLRSGGLTVRELFRRAAFAESADLPPERIFGPSTCRSRQFDGREIVRKACETARLYLAKHFLPFLPDKAYDTTLKPMAFVFEDKVPEGKSWVECVENEVLDSLQGEVAVATFARAT